MVRGLGFPGGSSGLLEGFRTTPRALAFQPLDSSLGWEEGKRHQPAVSAGAGAGEQEVWAGVVCSLGWAGAPLPRAEPLQVRPRARHLPLRMSWWVCSGTAYSLGHVQAQVRSRKPKTAV